MNEEEIIVIEKMEKYGGSFVQALATLFRKSDRKNFMKLKNTFDTCWKTYQKM